MTAKIITVFNQKGGCSKTMTSMQLGGTLGMMGLRVFVLDMDPQNTAALWHLQADADNPFPADVMSFAPLKAQFISKLESLVDRYDVIIIDCPPAIDSPVPWTALLVSDFALIPVIPVMDNVWASKQAEELVQKAQAERSTSGDHSKLLAAYVLSCVRRGKIFDACRDTLRAKAQIPILESKISMRNVFPESQLYGAVVGAFGSSEAKKEVDALAHEVAKMVGLSIPKKKVK